MTVTLMALVAAIAFACVIAGYALGRMLPTSATSLRLTSAAKHYVQAQRLRRQAGTHLVDSLLDVQRAPLHNEYIIPKRSAAKLQELLSLIDGELLELRPLVWPTWPVDAVNAHESEGDHHA